LPTRGGSYHLDAQVGEQVAVNLVVLNTGQADITSVRAKLKYDPDKVSVEMDSSNSAFSLAAPGEDNVDSNSGTVMIGRSLLGESRNDKQMQVVKLLVKLKQDKATIGFLNFQKSALGDTAIYHTSGVTNVNLLNNKPLSLVIGATKAAVNKPAEAAVHVPKGPPPLPRPNPVKIQTLESGMTSIIWALSNDSRVRGYYLYYGTRSGTYIRRKDLGLVNIAQITNLPKNQRYFFAVTAYDSTSKESDYSDEVTAIIGQPGTESHRFIGDPRSSAGIGGNLQQPTANTAPQTNFNNNINQLRRTNDSGPADAIPFLIFLSGIACLGLAWRRLNA